MVLAADADGAGLQTAHDARSAPLLEQTLCLMPHQHIGHGLPCIWLSAGYACLPFFAQDSALHWAAYKGNSQTLALLAYLGLPVDAADAYGSTPLHLAAMRGASNVVEFLLESSDSSKLIKMVDNKGCNSHSA